MSESIWKSKKTSIVALMKIVPDVEGEGEKFCGRVFKGLSFCCVFLIRVEWFWSKLGEENEFLYIGLFHDEETPYFQEFGPWTTLMPLDKIPKWTEQVGLDLLCTIWVVGCDQNLEKCLLGCPPLWCGKVVKCICSAIPLLASSHDVFFRLASISSSILAFS